MLKKIVMTSIMSIIVLAGLASCGNRDIPTPLTDELKLTASWEGKSFSSSGIGEATLVSATDGDTARFTDGRHSESELVQIDSDDKYAVRFVGVNTPESTANVQPWGKKASVWVEKKLKSAETIVLINDRDVFGIKDNSGKRYLGFIWYRTSKNADFRLLNLEIVEQCYSRNQLFKASTICPYLDSFRAAEATGVASGRRIFGEDDPGYDYTDKIIDTSIKNLRDNFDSYGVSDAGGGSSGTRLRIKAVILGKMGTSLVLRDITLKDADATTGYLSSIYAYGGYGNARDDIQAGDVIEIICRAAYYNNAPQLTDISFESFGDDALKILLDVNESTTEEEITAWEEAGDGAGEKYVYNVDPIQMDASNFEDYFDYRPYEGTFVETVVTVRHESTANSYYKKDDNGNITVYAKSSDSCTLNLRIDGTSFPKWSEGDFAEGKSYRVRAYLNPYFEKYQLAMFNADSEHLVEITN